MKGNIIRSLVFGVAVSLLAGCATQSPETVVTKYEVLPGEDLRAERIPGTVDEPWVEPMYDTIDIPGQLDATGVYYRLPHKTIVEIRPGRFQKMEYPGDRNTR